MPELRFAVRWPDGAESEHYSPSLVLTDHLREGTSYDLEDFVDRARTALGEASDRVEARYGHPCSLARRSSRQIAERAAASPPGSVEVLRFVRPNVTVPAGASAGPRPEEARR